MASDSPTLLSLLASEAEHLDFKAAGIETLNQGNSDHRDAIARIRARAQHLRAAYARLGQEIADAAKNVELAGQAGDDRMGYIFGAIQRCLAFVNGPATNPEKGIE